jgi:hypothetical protein
MNPEKMPTKLVTIVIGESYLKDFNETARDRFEAYAARCGYEPIIITEPIRQIPGKKLTWQKLCLPDLPWFREGTRVICLDCDILIANDAPPFPEVPRGYVGAVLDKGDMGINSGVLVYEASPEIADIFEECHKDPDPYWDQMALNRVLNERKRFHPIDPHFHCMFYVRSWTLFKSLFGHHWLYHSLSSKKKLFWIESLLRLQRR